MSWFRRDRTACPDCALSVEMVRAADTMRAKWEQMYRRQLERYAKLHTRTDEAERQAAEAKATLWMREAERDEARRQVAELASEAVILVDRARVAEASLSGVREQLRQAHVEHARVAQELEAQTTIDGLGLAMAELEKRMERKEYLDEDHAHVRRADGAGDHL